MPALLTYDDLAAYLHEDINNASADRAFRVAAGWLLAATRLPEWPVPLPDDLWTWAVELATLAYVNPEGLTSEVTGNRSATWAARREEILTAAAQRYGAGTPLGTFPAIAPYPDVVIRGYGLWPTNREVR